jgi:hypothetical protein
MTRLRGATFVCAAAGLGVAVAAAACSSSSNPTAPSADGGPEASVVAARDGASPDGATTVTLQWAVGDVKNGDFTVVSGDGGPTEAGASDAGDAGPTDGGAIDDAAAEAGVDDASGKVDGASLANLPPLPGVTVCVYQNSAIPCVTTQADGTFSLPGLPVRTDLVISLTKTGYNSYLLPIETASTDMDGRSNPVFMTPPSAAPPAIGVPVDFTTKGIITAFAVAVGGANMNVFSGIGGTQVALAPANANGPYYVDSDNQIELAATSFVDTTALFYNVDPGTYTLTYASSGYDCEPISFPFGQFGFPVTTPLHSLKIVVAAGYVTGIVGALCTVNPVIVAVDGG